jgi:hypothetical protein
LAGRRKKGSMNTIRPGGADSQLDNIVLPDLPIAAM